MYLRKRGDFVVFIILALATLIYGSLLYFNVDITGASISSVEVSIPKDNHQSLVNNELIMIYPDTGSKGNFLYSSSEFVKSNLTTFACTANASCCGGNGYYNDADGNCYSNSGCTTLCSNGTTSCKTIYNNTHLNSDVSNLTGKCFIFGASNIYLDCFGHKITGAGNYIIDTNFQNNITIRNCNINVSANVNGNCVYMLSTSNSSIYNNNITSAVSVSIFYGFASYNNFTNNWITNLGTGTVNGFYGGDDSNIIKNNFFNSSANSGGYGVYFSSSSINNLIYNNTLIIPGSGTGIYFFSGPNNNTIQENKITTLGPSSSTGLTLNGDNNTLIDNTINNTAGFSNAYGINLQSSGNILQNNNITTSTGAKIYSFSLLNNTLIYNNSYGLINWTSDNLTTNVTLQIGNTIYLENNKVGLVDDAQSLNLNKSSTVKFLGLSYNSQPLLLKNGVRCDNNSSFCNITFWNSTSGILTAQVASFSNYSTDGCGYINNNLNLSNDIYSNGTCFIINASNLILDCKGHNINYSINGDFGYGINITNFNNVTIKNCNIYTYTGGGADNRYSISLVNSSNSTIYNNNLSAGWNQGYTIYLGLNAKNNLVQNNNLITIGANAHVIYINQSNNNTFFSNILNHTSSFASGVYIYQSNGTFLENNTIANEGILSSYGVILYYSNQSRLINNYVYSLNSNEIQDSQDGGYINTLIYNNSFGEINWTRNNLTTNIILQIGNTIYLENNKVGLVDDVQSLNLNRSATVKFFGLGYGVNPKLLKNGVRCDNNSSLCNITSYSGGNLIAQIASFSNYSTQANIAPMVTSPQFNDTSLEYTENIGVNATYSDADNDSGNLTFYWYVNNINIYNHTINDVQNNTLLNSSLNKNNYTFGDKINVSVRAYDGLNNSDFNWSSTITVLDLISPSVFNLIPIANTNYNTSQTLEISLNVTDQIGISSVRANLTYSNGTYKIISLSNAVGEKYNASFTIPNLTGRYNLTFLVNDTSNNINNTQTTYFNVIDNSNPSVFHLIPISNTNYSITQSIEISSNATDNIMISSVQANLTYPNGTSQILALSNVLGNKYNTSFTIPNLLGKYNITILANDSSNNINNTENTYFNAVDLVPPVVGLVSPINNSIIDSSSVGLICNVTDFNLSNITLYTNISGNWSANQTFNIFGNYSQIQFNLSNLGDGSYIWNCLAYDFNNNWAFASSNNTFNIAIPIPPSGGGGGNNQQQEVVQTTIPEIILFPVVQMEEVTPLISPNLPEYTNSQEVSNNLNAVVQVHKPKIEKEEKGIPLPEERRYKVVISLVNNGNKTMKLIPQIEQEYEDPFFVIPTKTLGFENSLFSKISGLSYSKSIVNQNPLKARVLNSEQITLFPGEKIEKALEIDRGIGYKKIILKLTTLSDEKVFGYELSGSSTFETGSSVEVDINSKTVDLFVLLTGSGIFEKKSQSLSTGMAISDLQPESKNEYYLELEINKLEKGTISLNSVKKSLPIKFKIADYVYSLFFHPKLYFGDLYGPYQIKENKTFVFAQQLKYDPFIYNGDYQIKTKIYRGSEAIVENKFDVKLE